MAAIKRANKELADLLKVMNATDCPRPEASLHATLRVVRVASCTLRILPQMRG
jgi:hypothetical protein